jgi:type I restriction enzyme S subunit
MSITRLGDIAKIRTGKLDANASSENGKYPFFTCSKDTLRIDSYSYDCECVLVAGNGDLNVKYYKGKFDAYQRTYIIEDNSDGRLYIPYLYYYLDLYVEELRKQSIGGVIKYIKLGNLTDAIINLPSIETQKEIVKILDKSRKIIENKNMQLEEYDKLIKSRFVEMFGDPITNNKGWDVKDLNEITDVRDGTHDSPKYVDIGYPFVTSKNLVNGNIDFSTCQLISKDDLEKINQRSFVDDGDILMPMIGTIGGAIIVKKDRDFAIKNVALIKFNKENSIVDRKFILNVLNSDSMNEFFNSIKKGGTQNFISLGLIRKIPTIIPPLKLQNEFALFVEQVDKLKFAVQKSLDETQTLFDSLMQKYFG